MTLHWTNCIKLQYIVNCQFFQLLLIEHNYDNCVSFQSLFTKCLSQRIRHLRHDDKRKSGAAVALSTQKMRTCFLPSTSCTADQTVSPEDVQRNLDELRREWSKTCQSRNATHINMILDHTKDHLANLLKEDETGRIAPILAVYPCFEEGRYVSTLSLMNFLG